ncbi:MAG: hypothetical protein KDC54_18400 [Lewinella sp.]|nr:hypothetical protein [Lewinella sp.]
MALRSLFLTLAILCSVNAVSQTALLDKDRSLPCLDRQFLLMGHLTRDSSATVVGTPELLEDAVAVLNEWYAPICVSFQLARVDTIDNFQYTRPANLNELEQLWAHHHEPYRINIYIVSSLNNISGECTFAPAEGVLQSQREGVLIQANCLQQDARWLVHGFGHYCGLLHTNTDPGAELVDGSNCATTGDLICDTPADPFEPGSLTYTNEDYLDEDLCRFIFPLQDPNGHYYQPQTGNLMSQYPAHCWCGLTYDQYARMARVLEEAGLW